MVRFEVEDQFKEITHKAEQEIKKLESQIEKMTEEVESKRNILVKEIELQEKAYSRSPLTFPRSWFCKIG